MRSETRYDQRTLTFGCNESRRKCAHTHHGTSTNPQGMWPHPSRYVHKTAGNVGTPILVRPQNRRECGQTYLGKSTKPQGMWTHPSRYVHKTAGNVGTPILVRPQNRRECGHTYLGTSKSELGFGHSHLGFENASRFWAFLETGSPLLRKNEEPATSSSILHLSISPSFLPS